jgi:hypothetical protein
MRPGVEHEIREKFNTLKYMWLSELGTASRLRDMILLKPYQMILGMGPAVVPLLIEELSVEPNHWFWALECITGDDPVLPEHRGNLDLMTRAWLKWAEDHIKDMSSRAVPIVFLPRSEARHALRKG